MYHPKMIQQVFKITISSPDNKVRKALQKYIERFCEEKLNLSYIFLCLKIIKINLFYLEVLKS